MIHHTRTKVIPALIALSILIFLPEVYGMHRIGLEVDIDVQKSQIKGTARINVSADEEVVFITGALTVHEVELNGEPVEYEEFEGTLKIIPRHDGDLAIGYEGIFRDNGLSQGRENPFVENVIDERGVSLTNIWYPTHGGLSHYDLKATFPSGYIALSEAEDITKVEKKGKVEYHFRFPHRVDGINLVASDKYSIVKDEFRDIELYAYFFREDKKLATTYIEYTKKYLALYEDLVGMYPFKRFSVVENFLPTGYSMPTYTLLGSSVVKLPFIVRTSLGHEILHQWFGNSVYIDFDSGNWAEGLTTYLADHLYREQDGEGWKYRKQMLIEFVSYVDVESDIPLKYFTGRVDRPSRAIGYGKGAMVFHMLKNIVGKKVFFASLRDLIDNSRFARASWNDIRLSFQRQYGQDLSWFFSQWTENEGLLELTVSGAELSQSGKEYTLHFHIDQEGDFFTIKLPATIYFKDRVSFETLDISSMENSFDLTLQDMPHKIVFDEDYDIARGLDRKELPPVLTRLFGEDRILIAVPEGGEDLYKSVLDGFQGEGTVAKTVDDITISDIESNSLVILGIDNPILKRLYGKIPAEQAGFSVIMKENPWNPDRVVAIVHGTSREEVDSAFRKIFHYGKYTTLLFNKGVIAGKEIQASQRGLGMNLVQEATAIEVSSVKSLSDVIQGVADKKIVYVGEVHDVFAHHAVQLDIITGMYKKNPRLAIGMEMFQQPFQEILDRYIEGTMDEVDFLKESEYFQRWGFDYNLYKPILNFARTEKVPVIALNLKREIIRKVSQEGIDSLSDEEKNEIPGELDFSDNEYRERLKDIFSMHQNAGEKEFDHFYESQILWDETMSSSIAAFLEKNPDHSIVVLAGQGHLVYGSGIPKRTFRRTGADYAIIVIDEEVEKDIADYVVFPKPVEGVTTPKLMVFLGEEDGRMTIAGFPDQSVSEKAGLKVDDAILFLDDVEINSIEDIKIYLLSKQRGDFIKVKVLRKEEKKEEEIVIDVEL